VAEPKAFNLKIKPGDKALFKYRLIMYEGDWDKSKTEEQYQAYAK
jgi:hypothetical protein